MVGASGRGADYGDTRFIAFLFGVHAGEKRRTQMWFVSHVQSRAAPDWGRGWV